ncbi:hypothetical protein [Acaryochloris sp. CCMEE 5410]|nr:hypothetical protein [Acaryochloris sp. CCMEE 5410]
MILVYVCSNGSLAGYKQDYGRRYKPGWGDKFGSFQLFSPVG